MRGVGHVQLRADGPEIPPQDDQGQCLEPGVYQSAGGQIAAVRERRGLAVHMAGGINEVPHGGVADAEAAAAFGDANATVIVDVPGHGDLCQQAGALRLDQGVEKERGVYRNQGLDGSATGGA